MMTVIVVVACAVFAWFLFGTIDQGGGLEKSIVSPKPIEWSAAAPEQLGKWTVSGDKAKELYLIEAPSSVPAIKFGVYCIQDRPFIRWSGPGLTDPRGTERTLRLGGVPIVFTSSGQGSYYAQEPAKAGGLLFGEASLQIQTDKGETVTFEPTGYLEASQHLPISCRMVG